MPDYIKQSLIENNRDFFFHIFYNLQDSATVFTYRRPAFDSTYADKANENISHDLRELFSTDNSRVALVLFHEPQGKQHWKTFLSQQRLDRISQFRPNQHNILNMYSYHEACSNQIPLYEQEKRLTFRYIINTREDIYFFKPIDIRFLVTQYLHGSQCGLLTKGCLNWGGVNMRLQILHRDDGLKYLKRISFYKSMFDTGDVVVMPETMELLQTERLGIKLCNMSIEEFPVVAGRYSYINRTLCFTHQELKSYDLHSPPCVPTAHMDFAITHLCPREKTRYQFIPWQTTPFVPNSYYPHEKYFSEYKKKQLPRQPVPMDADEESFSVSEGKMKGNKIIHNK